MKYKPEEVEIVIDGKTFPATKGESFVQIESEEVDFLIDGKGDGFVTDAPLHGHYMCTKCPKCDRYRYFQPLPDGEHAIGCGCPKP